MAIFFLDYIWAAFIFNNWVIKSLFRTKFFSVLKTTTPAILLPKFSLLLLLSFFEGACVMVAELAGGKMLAPFYGTSIYVWASTLSITLGGLTIGYYIGGRLSEGKLENRLRQLFLITCLAAGLVIIMPVWANFIMARTVEMDFLQGLVLSQFCFLILPIVGMGMVSPLIIGLIGEVQNSGKAAGLVYAISTLGGIVATMLTGFWFIPAFGISVPCMIAGALLIIIAFLVLKPRAKLAGLAIVAILPTMAFINTEKNLSSDKFNLLYYSEGILGQVKVLEFKVGKGDKAITARNLLVNHNWQTWIDKDDPSMSFLFYTRFTNAIIASMPQQSKALLIGLGGGTVAHQFEVHKIDYDAVEIDGRLPALAKEYFGLKGTGNMIIDDGRHYVNTCKKKYDLIVIDALLGENIPSHLLSLECFNKLKPLLNDNGKIFIEFDGIKEGQQGEAQKLLQNTIEKAGYNCTVLSSIPQELDADIMYLATLKPINLASIQVSKDRFFEYSGGLDKFALSLPHPTKEVLTDDKPELDYLLRSRMAFLRNDVLKQANKSFLDDDVLFYY